MAYYVAKKTTITPGSTAYVHGSGLGGSINWKNEIFEIGGVVRSVNDLRSRTRFFSR
jgi:hypothetical protein